MSGSFQLSVVVIARPEADVGPALRALEAADVDDASVIRLLRLGGWAAARNLALESAADADVLALVEDDVRVVPGWGAAVRAAWDADAEGRLGAVGGPLLVGQAPAWLVGDHAEVLGLHPTSRPGPFPGGNVAFRVTALRGVGGFFPVRGHRDARDTVGDDYRAQHELAAAGWELAYIPGMAAERDLREVRAADLVRRRVRAGARGAALLPDAPSRARALALTARAGAGAAVAALRGDRPRALDRAAWAAHGAGAALGSVLVHAELQPDCERTPWRPSVPAPELHPARRLAARRRRAGADVHGAVLLYHRIATLDADPLALAVTPEHFAQQLEVLCERWTPAPLEAVIAGQAGPHAVAVTFDDGYHDNLAAALPALAAAGVPATLFASSGHVARGEGYWWDEVTTLLAEPHDGTLTVEAPGGRRAWRPVTSDAAATTRAQLHAGLRVCDRPTITAALAALRVWAGNGAEPTPPPESDRPLSVTELRDLAAAGPFSVQAHGRTHLSLARTPAAARDEELRGCADDLQGWLRQRPTMFSYPFGVPGVDVDAATCTAARAAGYVAATVNAPGLVRADTDPLAIPRLAVADTDGVTFGRWLEGVLPGR